MTNIIVGGVDITDHVLFADTIFSGNVNGSVGEATINVRDDGHTFGFRPGQEVWLEFGADRIWGGYVMRVARKFPFEVLDTTSPTEVSRYWTLSCADYNVLFEHRFLWDQSDPKHIKFNYDAGVYDDTVIFDILDNYLSVEADDGISRAGVERVDVAILDIPGLTSGKGSTNGGVIASGSYSWRQMMDSIARATGAVYFIDPYKVLHYTDAGEQDTDYFLTDSPDDAYGIGYQGLSIVENGSRRINDMFVWGATPGSPKIVFSRYQDLDNQADHGLWQHSLMFAKLYRQTSADRVARSYVDGTVQSQRGAKDDAISFNCKFFEPVFRLGQKVRAINSVFEFDRVIPIRHMEVSFIARDTPVFTMTLSTEIDSPWAWQEYLWPKYRPRIEDPTKSRGKLPFDIFDRFSSTNSWATSTDGHPWDVPFVPYPLTTGVSVENSYGAVKAVAPTGLLLAQMRTSGDSSVTAPWHGDFTARCSITMDVPFNDDPRALFDYLDFGLADSVGNHDAYLEVVWSPLSGGNFLLVLFLPGGVSDSYDFGYFQPFVRGQTYIFKLKREGTTWSGKVWNESVSEPDWMVTATESVVAFNPDGVYTGLRYTNLGANINVGDGVKYNYILFQDNSMFPGAPAGYLVEYFLGDGSQTVYTLGRDFYAGSTRVTIDGLRQILRVNYNENGAQAYVEFTTPPRLGTLIVVIYRPNAFDPYGRVAS